MPVPPPAGRFETSRGEVCWWSGTNISNKYFINRRLDGSHCSLKPRSFSKRKKHSSRSANNRALLARLDKHSGLTRETNWAAKELVGKFGHSCNIYYIHSQIIYHPCTLIGSQQCEQFTNRTIFCSKSHIFPSRWEAILEQFIRFHSLFNVTNQIVVKWRQRGYCVVNYVTFALRRFVIIFFYSNESIHSIPYSFWMTTRYLYRLKSCMQAIKF